MTSALRFRSVDELRAAVRDLADAPSAESADAFVRQLTDAANGPELGTFITETLELTALHQVTDSSGATVRWRLVDRLLSLGFPHALLVSPDDLDYHRERSRSSERVPAVLTAIAAVLSTAWSFSFALMAVAVSSRNGWEVRLATLLLFLASAHNVTALVAGVKASRGQHSPALAPLGWSVFGVLGVAGLAQLIDRNGAFITLFLAAPTLVTSLLCALTAALSKTRPPELETPKPQEAAEAEAAVAAPRAKVRA